MQHPITSRDIERLANGKLSTYDSLRIQRHIYTCAACLKRLIEITLVQEECGKFPQQLCPADSPKPLSFVHDTADGFIHSSVERHGRKWFARHTGEQLEGLRICRTMREANEFVVAAFNQMFPEHRCTARCRAKVMPR
jgi:hypothetical protein